MAEAMDVLPKGITPDDIEPTLDQIFICLGEKVEATKGGILLPDTAQEQSQIGNVISSGPGRLDHGELIPPPVHHGEVVLTRKFQGIPIRFFDAPDVEYRFIVPDQILAIVNA